MNQHLVTLSPSGILIIFSSLGLTCLACMIIFFVIQRNIAVRRTTGKPPTPEQMDGQTYCFLLFLVCFIMLVMGFYL